MFRTQLRAVGKIVECGNEVTFTKNGCFITNSKNELVASSTARNGVYKLKSKLNMCISATKKDNAMLWHRRMGHINFNSLKKCVMSQ